MTKPLRYANPAFHPEAKYVGVGPDVYEPYSGRGGEKKHRKVISGRGLDVAGTPYQSGEALTERDLAALPPHVLAELEPLLHTRQDQAVHDYVRFPGPTKDLDVRRIGERQPTGYEDAPAYLPDPDDKRVPPEVLDRLGPTKRSLVEKRSQLTADAAQHLTDEEVSVLSPKEAQAFVDLFNTAVPSFEWAVGAKLGRAKRGWYQEAADALVGLFGYDAPRFAALLAATSPVKSVQDNLRNALTVWRHYNDFRADLGRDPTVQELRAWLPSMVEEVGAGRSVMSSEVNNVLRALSDPNPGRVRTLSGPKVDSFTGNLLGDLARVTNDTWMAAFAGVKHKDLQGTSVDDPRLVDPENPNKVKQDTFGGAYLALTAKARMAAEHLNSQLRPGEKPWQPAEIQETVWSVFRALGAAMGQPRYQHRKQGGLAAGLVPDPIAALEGLKNADVHANADFLTLLLSDHHARAALERIFPAEALDRLDRFYAQTQGRRGEVTGRAIEGLSGRDELTAAQNIARRAGLAAGRFMTPVATLGRKGPRKRYMARPANMPQIPGPRVPLPHSVGHINAHLKRLAELHKNPRVQQLAAKALRTQDHDTLLDLAEEFVSHPDNLLNHEYFIPALDNYLKATTPFGYDDQWNEDAEAHYRAGHTQAIDWATFPYVKAAQVGRQLGHYSQHPDPEARALGHAAYTEEDDLAHDLLADWHEDRGEIDQARRVRTLKHPYYFSRRKYAADPITGKPALVAASGNTETEMSFDQALQRSRSADQKVFRQTTDRILEQIGLRGQSVNAVGDWEDGAEHSVLTELPDNVDLETLRYVGAWQGLLGNQRAVLVFQPHSRGLDSVYEIEVPESDIAKVRQQLSASQVPFRTIVPTSKGTRVVVYDQGRALRDNITRFAGGYGAVVRESTGQGEFIGGDSRTAARAAYRKIISAYEAQNARAATGGGQVRPSKAKGPGSRRNETAPA